MWVLSIVLATVGSFHPLLRSQHSSPTGLDKQPVNTACILKASKGHMNTRLTCHLSTSFWAMIWLVHSNDQCSTYFSYHCPFYGWLVCLAHLHYSSNHYSLLLHYPSHNCSHCFFYCCSTYHYSFLLLLRTVSLMSQGLACGSQRQFRSTAATGKQAETGAKLLLTWAINTLPQLTDFVGWQNIL